MENRRKAAPEEDAMSVNLRRAVQPAVQGPQALAALTLILGLAVFLASLWLLPRPLILPAISVLLLAAAAGIAFIAWRRPKPHQSQLTYWDLAGAVTFIGIAAALLSEPDQALPLLEGSRPLRTD
jgi:hypothetical protein